MAEVIDRLCRKINIDSKLASGLSVKVKKEWFKRTFSRNDEDFKWRIQDPNSDWMVVSRSPARELVKSGRLKFKKIGHYIVVTGSFTLDEKSRKRLGKVEIGASHLEMLPAKIEELIERLESGATKPADGTVELALMLKNIVRLL